MNDGDDVRSINDGQRGRIVKNQDGVFVRLDRNMQEILVPYHAYAWVEDHRAAMSPMQIARVQYAADIAYRECCGEYRLPDWTSLQDAQKIAFMGKGPQTTDKPRLALYAAIRELMA